MREAALHRHLLAALRNTALSHIDAFFNSQRRRGFAGQTKLPPMPAWRQQQNRIAAALQAGFDVRVKMKTQMKRRPLARAVVHIGQQ